MENNFGFLVLFNGRLERELKSIARAAALGASDAQAAADAAAGEGFRPRTIIFLDQEEGGRMQPDQMAYIFAWIDGVTASGFRAGIYCSGIPASEGRGQFVVTANDIAAHLAGREVTFFVYNDACPPAPGCAYGHAPQPADSGVAFASVWQFAQSPRRKEFTASCPATYNRDGNCYAPGGAAPAALLDLDTATSPDPSKGGRTGRTRKAITRDNVAQQRGGNQRQKTQGDFRRGLDGRVSGPLGGLRKCDQRFELRAGCAGINRLRGEARAIGEIAPAARGYQSCGGICQHNVPA